MAIVISSKPQHTNELNPVLSLIKSASLVESAPAASPEALETDTEEIPEYLTDARMAECFISLNRHQLRYWHNSKSWIDYDGSRWKEDSPGGPFKFIKPMLDSMLDEVLAHPYGPERDKLLKALLTRESSQGQKNLVTAAANLVDACIETPDIDGDNMLFNCLNGTVNLATGELQPHRPDDYITKMASVKFDPLAKCPTFEKFMNRIMDGNKDLIAYMQRWLGYCLTGDVSEHVMQIRHGTGANGKSVLSNIEGALLGDYAKAAGGYLLLKQQNSGNDNTTQSELAKLRGARLARISEIDEGARLAEAQLKNITGGDTITCRALYKSPIEYYPAFKITLLCNHTPLIRGTDFAIWRRIHKVPFAVTIPPEEQDKDLLDKLKTELPGILNWAIAGCLEFQKQGLKPPKAVLDATADYKNSEDMFASWLNECCSIGDGLKAKSSELYKSFVTYSGWKSISTKKFGGMLSENKFDKSKSNGSVWNGLELLEPSPYNSEKVVVTSVNKMFSEKPLHGSNGYEDEDLASQL